MRAEDLMWPPLDGQTLTTSAPYRAQAEAVYDDCYRRVTTPYGDDVLVRLPPPVRHVVQPTPEQRDETTRKLVDFIRSSEPGVIGTLPKALVGWVLVGLLAILLVAGLVHVTQGPDKPAQTRSEPVTQRNPQPWTQGSSHVDSVPLHYTVSK